jgi:hypothetical protein
MSLGSTQHLTEKITGNLPGYNGRSVRKAESVVSICEPIV